MVKKAVLTPKNQMALDTLRGVRGEMARLYRLALNRHLPSIEMTRFVYALKEIRACIEAELLADIQMRLAMLTREIDGHGYVDVAQPALTDDRPVGEAEAGESGAHGPDGAAQP